MSGGPFAFFTCACCAQRFEQCDCAGCREVPLAPKPLCEGCLRTFHKVESVLHPERSLPTDFASDGFTVGRTETIPISEPNPGTMQIVGITDTVLTVESMSAADAGATVDPSIALDFANIIISLELLRVAVITNGSKLATCGHEVTEGGIVVHHQQAAGAFGDPPEEGANDSWYSAVTSCLACCHEVARRPLHPAGEVWREDIELLAYSLADQRDPGDG